MTLRRNVSKSAALSTSICCWFGLLAISDHLDAKDDEVNRGEAAWVTRNYKGDPLTSAGSSLEFELADQMGSRRVDVPSDKTGMVEFLPRYHKVDTIAFSNSKQTVPDSVDLTQATRLVADECLDSLGLRPELAESVARARRAMQFFKMTGVDRYGVLPGDWVSVQVAVRHGTGDVADAAFGADGDTFRRLADYLDSQNLGVFEAHQLLPARLDPMGRLQGEFVKGEMKHPTALLRAWMVKTAERDATWSEYGQDLFLYQDNKVEAVVSSSDRHDLEIILLDWRASHEGRFELVGLSSFHLGPLSQYMTVSRYSTAEWPTERVDQAMIYDPLRDRVLLFGGRVHSSLLNDTWSLSLAGTPTWTRQVPAGTLPSARWGHTGIYDPVRDRMLVFGGRDSSSSRNDTWSLSLGGVPRWTLLSTAGNAPSARWAHSAIYDPVRDRMLVFGGSDNTGLLNKVWALSLGDAPTWTELKLAGSSPRSRRGHTAIYDPVRDRMLVFGGRACEGDNCGSLGDVWELSLESRPMWTELDRVHLEGWTEGVDYAAVYDPVGDRVVFPWEDGEGSTGVKTLSLSGGMTWTSGSEGIDLVGWGPHMAICDPKRNRLMVFSHDIQDIGWQMLPEISATEK